MTYGQSTVFLALIVFVGMAAQRFCFQASCEAPILRR